MAIGCADCGRRILVADKEVLGACCVSARCHVCSRCICLNPARSVQRSISANAEEGARACVRFLCRWTVS